MKILWLCNILLPKISAQLGLPASAMGGWLVGLSNDLMQQPQVELAVCFPVFAGHGALRGEVENICYLGFPQSRRDLSGYSTQTERLFVRVLQEEQPDIVHIFGTEYSHTLAMVRACTQLGIANRVVINIQGLVSVYANHYSCALPEKAIHSYTLRDLLRRENIAVARTLFKKRGVYEKEALRGVQHIIGRTDWDRACTEQINPTATYHFCNETLRDAFYIKHWELQDCEKHSIFISQCGYPIKGFHLMLEAMPEILKRYPDAHIYTTGINPLLSTGFAKLKQTYYSKYLGALIRRYGLVDHVTFLGSLQEGQMCEQFIRSHVFVSPSSIENSPNSVGEAMLLGVPVVSSDVGGVKNLLTHGEEGFIYPYDEQYMIAYYVCRLFGDDALAKRLSQNATIHAKQLHNREINLQNMLLTYKEIKR